MALKPTTGLETHPVNTAGLNGIITGNWERLEAIFLPLAASGSQPTISWDSSNRKFIVRAGTETLTWSATQTISLAGARNQILSLTGNTTFASSNLQAGSEARVVVTCDGTLRTLAFPAGWKFVGAKPTDIAASKTGLLELISTTAADTGVIARWTVEP